MSLLHAFYYQPFWRISGQPISYFRLSFLSWIWFYFAIFTFQVMIDDENGHWVIFIDPKKTQLFQDLIYSILKYVWSCTNSRSLKFWHFLWQKWTYVSKRFPVSEWNLMFKTVIDSPIRVILHCNKISVLKWFENCNFSFKNEVVLFRWFTFSVNNRGWSIHFRFKSVHFFRLYSYRLMSNSCFPFISEWSLYKVFLMESLKCLIIWRSTGFLTPTATADSVFYSLRAKIHAKILKKTPKWIQFCQIWSK